MTTAATPAVRQGTLADLSPDPRNPRRHTPRNRAAVVASLQEVGVVRPLAAAADGTLIAGNLTADALAEIGLDDVIIVESDGTRPIVHVRTDIAPGSPAAIKAGLYDNRAAELADGYDPQVLAALLAEVPVASTLLTEAEAAYLIAGGTDRETLTFDHAAIITGGGDYHDEREYPAFRADRDGRYDATLLRQIVLIMDRATYVRTLLRLRLLAEQEDLETNADVVRWLLDQHVPVALVEDEARRIEAAAESDDAAGA